jgi:hypothetical protein
LVIFEIFAVIVSCFFLSHLSSVSIAAQLQRFGESVDQWKATRGHLMELEFFSETFSKNRGKFGGKSSLDDFSLTNLDSRALK